MGLFTKKKDQFAEVKKRLTKVLSFLKNSDSVDQVTANQVIDILEETQTLCRRSETRAQEAVREKCVAYRKDAQQIILILSGAIASTRGEFETLPQEKIESAKNMITQAMTDLESA